MDIKIYPDEHCDFPIGGMVTIVTTDDEIDVQATGYYENDENLDPPSVHGAGFATTSEAWRMPMRTIGTLVKTAANEYTLSAANLENNDG